MGQRDHLEDTSNKILRDNRPFAPGPVPYTGRLLKSAVKYLGECMRWVGFKKNGRECQGHARVGRVAHKVHRAEEPSVFERGALAPAPAQPHPFELGLLLELFEHRSAKLLIERTRLGIERTDQILDRRLLKLMLPCLHAIFPQNEPMDSPLRGGFLTPSIQRLGSNLTKGTRSSH